MNELKRGPGRPAGSFLGMFPTRQNGKQTRMYRKWTSMLARCYQPSHPANHHYKAKGIKVCARWRGREGFDRFMQDLGECPPGLTLERKDNAGDYCPGNCRWATWQEQANNRDRNGKAPDPNSLKQRAITAGLPYSTVYQRVALLHWPVDKALSTPKLHP